MIYTAYCSERRTNQKDTTMDSEFTRQHAPAASGAQERSDQCDEVTASLARGHEATAEQVSPAISPAISPSTDENYKIESDGNQSGNKSGTGNGKPNCYKCKHRRDLVWDAHSKCDSPRLSFEDRVASPVWIMHGMKAPAMKRLNVSGNPHGVKNGWFMWPMNFDPVWLESCDDFDPN